MTAAYHLSPLAQEDIEALVDFIASDDIDTALRVEQELYDAFDLLASRPLIGHTRADLGIGPRLRVWPFYSYLIVYRPHTSPLEVVRVWAWSQTHSHRLVDLRIVRSVQSERTKRCVHDYAIRSQRLALGISPGFNLVPLGPGIAPSGRNIGTDSFSL